MLTIAYARTCCQLIIQTNYQEEKHDLRRVAQATSLTDVIHHLARSTVLQIRIGVLHRSPVPGRKEADLASHLHTVMRPLPHFSKDPCGNLAQ